MDGGPTFFELGVEDVERARVFFGELFGWTLSPGPSGEGYTIGTSTLPGGLHGGDPGAGPYLFFAVDDINAATQRVRDLGGTVEGTDLGGEDAETVARFGRFKLCRDDQGTPFGLHEPPPPHS
ncbi:VOC family protein [Streptomyces sp. OF3]|uniref:VOC family protein n=2 Tax=Streptomyces alkaliterrae TaxID=2213162 RepID=A0A7W3WMM4_9ACTN|nr:VOC family protein [Streptomyces alkaliterrae]MBB1254715.1 VOC family protein [Streptomyces alkaliterrae]MBB1260125.1 VOC family protein [Streptomyces alkaliterrae]